jgi:flagellar biosynthetic protein FlhB
VADPDRTFAPTQKRREDARRKGQVPRSREVVSVLVLAGGVLALSLGGEGMWRGLQTVARQCFDAGGRIDLSSETVGALGVDWLLATGAILMPVLLASSIGALAGGYGQVGLLISGDAVSPQLSRVSPIAGFKRLFSLNALMELLRGVAKIVVLGVLLWVTLRRQIDAVLGLGTGGVEELLPALGQLSFQMMRNVLVILALLAIADFAYQRWKHTQDLRMTHQEVKEEYRQTEGDPLLRSRIRSLQREMATKRMMAEVPTADVVITNPTHYAVALRYRRGEDVAPRVVAKGGDHLAQRIKAIAREHGVMLREDKLLARALYRTVDIGRVVPEELYRAVAEVLAYVYRARRDAQHRGYRVAPATGGVS